MYQVGQRLKGAVLNEDGTEYVDVEGTYMFTTDDPGEMIQDVVIKTDDGRTVYVDEQDIRPVTLTNFCSDPMMNAMIAGDR